MKTIITGLMRSGTNYLADAVSAATWVDGESLPALHEPFNRDWQGGPEHPDWDDDTRASIENRVQYVCRHSGHYGDLNGPEFQELGGSVAARVTGVANAVNDQYGACDVWRVMQFPWWGPLSVVLRGIRVLYIERSPLGWLSSAARTIVLESRLPLVLPRIADVIADEEPWPGHAGWCDLGRSWCAEAGHEGDEATRLAPLYVAAAYHATETDWQYNALKDELDKARGDDLMFVQYDQLVAAPEVYWPRVFAFVGADPDSPFPNPIDTAQEISSRTFAGSVWTAADVDTVLADCVRFQSRSWRLAAEEGDDA